MTDSPDTPRLFPDRSADEALNVAHRIARDALREYRPVKTFLLFSGGNDSAVLLDTMWGHADAIVHINTGIGIPEAHEFARQAAKRYPLPFLEYRPPIGYRTLVLKKWKGLPGPGMHNIVYQRLKERCIEQLWRDHRTGERGERYVLLSGIRRAESPRRKQRTEAVERKGARVYVKPLFDWSNDETRTYHRVHNLPTNPVAANLHMSGECLCGAMAGQDETRAERAAIRFFYPEFDKLLTEIENEAKALGLPYTEWGVRRPDMPDDDDGGELCQSCAWRQERLALEASC